MKKLIGLLLVIVMFAAIMVLPANAAENPTISVKSVAACPGKEVNVDVSVRNSTGIGTCLIALDYNKDALELTGLKAVQFSNGLFEANVNTGKVAFIASSDMTGDGVLFTATFKVKDDAEGAKEVKVLVEEMTNAAGNVTPSITNGSVTVGHSFTKYASNNDATCSKDGTETAVCDRGCGAKDTRNVANSKTNHKYTNYTSNNDATCTKDGTKTASCDYGCGTKDTVTDTGSKKAHKYTTYVSNNDATCTKDGTKTASCDNGCGTKDTVTDTGSKKGHKYTTYVSNNNATCTKDGTKTASCDNGCGTKDTVTDTGSKKGHKYTTYVSNNDATCTKDGTKTASCDNGCGSKDTVTDAGTKKAHEWQDATCTEPQKCKNCTATQGKPLGHAADSDNDHYCDRCKTHQLTDHNDANKDHKCDSCGKTVTECADTNKDHKCDTCGKTMSECADTNKDHKCDTCGKTMSECADTNKDHKCDTCGKTMSECADTNKDHKCDTCNETLSSCEDKNNDGKCDICGTAVETDDKIFRVYGADRIETALAVAEELKTVLNVEKFDSIILAAGGSGSDQTKFADALSGSYLATSNKAPILLYTKGDLSAQNLAFIQENLSANGTIYLLGGNVSIPAEVEEALKAEGYNTKRLGGTDRYDTNLIILKEAGIADADEILVASGRAFADSLSASATGLPIMLVNGNKTELTEAQVEFLQSVKGKKITILGGTAAVTAELEAAINEAADTEADRIFGNARENTSAMVAQKYFADADTALIAYSKMYPDGLAGGVLANALKAPLLLTKAGSESIANAYIEESGISSGYVLGGTAVLTDDTARAVFGLSNDVIISTK